MFEYFVSTLLEKITQWDYFVNWKKVLSNVAPIEDELNLLNSLIGKQDIEKEAERLFSKYPSVVKALPSLLAVRDNSVKVLVDANNFVYQNFDFDKQSVSKEEAVTFVEFIKFSGISELIENKRIKNFVDYVIGVEVGLDSNGRKNRGGSLMEKIVETFVADACNKISASYIPQAKAKKILNDWGIKIQVDKSSRIIDFAVNKKGRLYFIETNFYGGGGSKLKATASEYTKMSSYYKSQGIEFIWITDGQGWHTTLNPLREYFDSSEYLLNLEMLKNGVLHKILNA